MNGNGVQNGSNRSKKYISNDEYIEKKIDRLSIYDTYWCLFMLRSQHKIPQSYILKDDAGSKLSIISILKDHSCTKKDIDRFLQTSARNSIPLSYVKWFYEDARAALWMHMALKKLNIISDPIGIESDIAIFVHDVIFNRKFAIGEEELCEVPDTYYERWIINKKKGLDVLKNIYLRSSVEPKETKWLDYDNDIQINHLYAYMQKLHDIDNLKANKESKNHNKKSISNKDKTGHRQALIFADTIRFRETDTASRLHHMLASLDYWEGIAVDEGKVNNRSTFIDNMYEAWLSKAKRDRDKNMKEKGLVLTSANKKTLSLIAKRQGKTRAQMLNDIIASYNQTFFSEVPKTTRAAGTYITGDYGKPYTDTFETQQSLKAKQASSETILVDSDNEETKDINHQIESLESVPNIKDSNEDKSEEHVENFVEKEYNDQYKNPEDINNNTDNSIDEPIFDIIPPKDVITHVNTPTSETDVSTMRSQVTESNLASADNLHRIYQIVADEDPFSKNARIANQKMGRK